MGVCEAAAESSIKKSKQLLQTVYNNSSVLLKLYLKCDCSCAKLQTLYGLC